MVKNKKLIVIIFLIILIVTLLFIHFSDNKNNITFLLNGEDNILIEYGSKFNDPGFIAKDGHNNDISSYVTKTGKVDVYTSGVYKIVYELKYNDKEEALVRIVKVKDINISDLEIVLNGDEEVYVYKDSTYSDEGAYIHNIVKDTVFEDGDISITNNVNTNSTGVYEVNYSFNYNGKVINATRRVVVFDITSYISPETITPNKVKISLDLGTVKNYSNTKLPNGETILSKNVEYEVDRNGEYDFIVSLINKQKFTKTVTVENIIANYTCTGQITNNGTKLEVSPLTSEVKGYEWIINNVTSKGNNTYTKEKIIKNASVNLTFNNNEKYQVKCTIADKLTYHFKYDINNTKPYMRCNTYTAQDKVKFDQMLKQVVDEAGYGSRAGVVAAARFLVGGLDYKVPYQGGIYYRKAGLNIGQKNAWGCSGSGLDCYSTVIWARAQNGLPEDALYGGTKYRLADRVNYIKVGDYVLTPCTSSTCKNVFKINHIGIIIGIDDKYIYVAENKTAGVDAFVVTRLDKSNLPRSGNLSLVKHVNYPKEGNITNMWMSE